MSYHTGLDYEEKLTPSTRVSFLGLESKYAFNFWLERVKAAM
jgi:hypothetical protein